jgi:hypothetical protein
MRMIHETWSYPAPSYTLPAPCITSPMSVPPTNGHAYLDLTGSGKIVNLHTDPRASPTCKRHSSHFMRCPNVRTQAVQSPPIRSNGP